MTLCSLCQDIPFGSLPDPPPTSGHYSIGDSREIPVLLYSSDAAETTLADPLGFPWHPDLDALALSASSCAFCGIIQDGVKAWLGDFELAQKNPIYAEFHGNSDKMPSGQPLWVTKRYGGAPGILVFVRQPLRESRIYLLTGVGFCVDVDNPSSGALRLQPMDLDSGSPRSLSIAASFLQTCDKDHECGAGVESPLPSRLLDVGEAGDIIKLVDTGGQAGEYACLSHCWGDVPHFMTLRESIDARRAGTHLNDLPKTYVDAIIITRYLHLRYLWIDAFCICQDDIEDWARESANVSSSILSRLWCRVIWIPSHRIFSDAYPLAPGWRYYINMPQMINVYSSAHLVIAANRASDNAQGCFHIRSPRRTRLVDLPGYASDVYVQSVFNSDALEGGCVDFRSHPLSQRAWALQERLLARRILHYNESQVYFECDHGMMSEDGLFLRRRYLDISHLRPTKERQISDTETPSEVDHSLWDRVIWEYGRRKLTQPTDKLPALSGLAKIFEMRFQAQYIAGLWSTSVIKGLAWQGLGDRKPQAVSPNQYIGPSWSWASYAGIAASGSSEGWKTIAEIIDWEVHLKSEANPYGEIRSASLRLRGPMAPLVRAKLETTDHDLRLRRVGLTPLPRLQTRYSDREEGNFVKFDYEENQRTGIWKKFDLYVLVLGGYHPQKGTSEAEASAGDNEGDEENQEDKVEIESYFGLVVTRVDDGKPESGLKRLGWTFLSGPEGEKLAGDPSNWKTVTLL